MTTTDDDKPAEVWLQWYGEEEPDMDDLPAKDAITWDRRPVFDNDAGPYVLDLGERLAATTQRAEKAERERDAERAQRIHEATLASEAIGHLRALLADSSIDAETKAQAFLDEKVRV